MSTPIRLPLLALAALLAGSAPAARANPNDPLRAELAELARSVKGVLEEEKQTAVAVENFTAPPRLDSQFGPGIQAALAEELGRQGVSVNKRADLTLTGSYSDAEENRNGEPYLVLKINVRVLSRNGDEFVKLTQKLTPRRITDNTTIAKVTGVTASLNPAADKQSRNEFIQKAVKDPAVSVDGTRVSAKAGANLAVEVLVRPAPGAAAVARAPKVVDGQAVVEIGRDELYELRLHNTATWEGAVTINIDGVDVFQFSQDRDPKTGLPRFGHVVVPPKAVSTVAAWHRTGDLSGPENVWPFRITEYGGGPRAFAANFPTSSRLRTGVITVTLAAASLRAEDHPDPAVRMRWLDVVPVPGRKDETRQVGLLREVVSIRYSR